MVIFKFLFPITACGYWFLPIYLGIIITSPIINAGLNSLSQTQLRSFICIFTIFTIYSCGIGHNICNEDGYTYLQGIYMYSLGYTIRKENAILNRFSITYSVSLFFIISFVGGLGLASLNSGKTIFRDYNGIFIVFASALLFIAFTKISFRSKFINFVAQASLGCYLLQDGFFGNKLLYGWLQDICTSNINLFSKLSVFAGVFLITWVVSMTLTLLFNQLSKSVSSYIENKLPTKLVKFININKT